MMYKLAALAPHPIQYQAPLFRKLADHPDIDLTVYFCWDYGEKGEFYSSEFGKKIKWDVPVLEGYKYKFLPNLSPRAGSSFLGQINPSIIKELFNNKYDAVWIHGYATLGSWFAFFGAWLCGTPIFLRGESHLVKQRDFWKRAVKYGILPLFFKGISAFLTVGSLNKKYYRFYGVSNEKMFLTPYAVDNDFFSDRFRTLNGKREQLKKEMGMAVDLPVILFASKMIPRKRPMDLLRAYVKIQERINAVLVFVGDGIERSLLEAYTKDNNLKNVYFTGFKNQTELPYYFAIADVFVLPSDDEPWGLIINEAMNFGLPIVTTEVVGSAPDLVKDGINGFIYPAGDIEKLVNCLSKVLEQSELRKNMRKDSLRKISEWSFKEDVEGIMAALNYNNKFRFT